MKKALFIAVLALFVACNSKNNEAAKPGSESNDGTSKLKEINSPYAINYSSKFVTDDPKNAETLLNLWKVWDGGDLSKAKDMFADTVEFHFSNGTIMKLSRDSAINISQKARTAMGTSVSSVDAIMAVKATDKNEHWACIWGMEKDTNAKGKSDSSYVQETWRFDSTGRANLMFQFRAASAPPPTMKK